MPMRRLQPTGRFSTPVYRPYGLEMPEQRMAEGGVVDHDYDRELPRAQDDARLIQMMPQTPPAYIATIQRLIDAQRRLNSQLPQQRPLPPYQYGGWVPVRYRNGGWIVPRYWNGGWVW
jgi:hypothetical protein